MRLAASSGTELVSGVILNPVVVMTVSGKLSVLANPSMVANRSSSKRNLFSMYLSQGTDRFNGNSLLLFRVINSVGGNK